MSGLGWVTVRAPIPAPDEAAVVARYNARRLGEGILGNGLDGFVLCKVLRLMCVLFVMGLGPPTDVGGGISDCIVGVFTALLEPPWRE